MTRWLSIIGMGEDGFDGLSAQAQNALREADVIVGADRLLAMLPALKAERQLWPQPFSEVIARILPLRERRTVVLATGDPLNYGVARKLLKMIPFSETRIIPHFSAFTLAAARLGWSIPDCDCLTLHGRPAANIESFIQPDAKLLVLTADATTIPEVARRLVRRSYGRSEITVLENMGGPLECCTSFSARAIPDKELSDLNTLAIQCLSDPGAAARPRVAGLADEAFKHDGQLTKREVRASTIAALGPYPDALLWDVGAGCGSVAIEWMRSTRGASAIAVEPNADRRAMIAENCDILGTPRLRIVAGSAPEALVGLPAPDAVFIGGGLGDAGVFETCWAALRPQGQMVINTVTLEGELHLVDLQEKYGGDLVRIEVSNLTRVGTLRALRPKMAVLQWRASKT